MIDDYFQSLLAAIAASPFVRASEVSFDKRSPYIGFIRGNIYFRDGSLLHFRELVNLNLSALASKYVYHHQRADGSLVFRYDNSNHFPQLPNFPHHEHIGEGRNVVGSEQPDLAAVLKEIESLIPSS